MSARLFAIMVTFRRGATALETLQTVLGQNRSPDLVVVVDNDPSDGLAESVNQFPQVRYLPSPSNVGPAGGFAAGMNHILEIADDDDYLLLVDDDDPIPEVDLVIRLISVLESFGPEDRVGCVGHTGSRFDRRSGRMTRVPDDELHGIVDVDFVAGNQFPIVRIEALRAVGPYDPELFFGFEEADFGLRLKSAGWRVVVDGGLVRRARVRWGRLGGGSRRAGSRLAPWRRYYSSRNIVLIARRHGRAGSNWRAFLRAGPAAALRAVVVHRSLTTAWMAMRGAAAGLLGHTGMPIEPK
jgi:rhamnopyranosyl-N-acetylglucosaminyl-diphospho-decaprenol beta-1,3/1,4-galactofuranosyltransferase